MEWLDRLVDGWNALVDRVRPGFDKTGQVLRYIGKQLSTLWTYIFRLRAIILAAPVAAAAAVLASTNLNRLPEQVEMTMLSYEPEAEDAMLGLFVMTTDYISRDTAVFGPLMITVACLLLTLCSKRTLYPWIISVFSLCLPLVLYAFSIYPM